MGFHARVPEHVLPPGVLSQTPERGAAGEPKRKPGSGLTICWATPLVGLISNGSDLRVPRIRFETGHSSLAPARKQGYL